MKVANIFESHYKKFNYKRFRLKCDPANPGQPYEGYILSEHGGMAKCFMVGAAQPFQTIPVANIIQVQNPLLGALKAILIKEKYKELAPQFETINCINDLEDMFLSNGGTKDEFYGAMRQCFK